MHPGGNLKALSNDVGHRAKFFSLVLTHSNMVEVFKFEYIKLGDDEPTVQEKPDGTAKARNRVYVVCVRVCVCVCVCVACCFVVGLLVVFLLFLSYLVLSVFC